MSTEPKINELLRVMAALRNPDGGCPWDLEQDFTSIAPYTIEEAYEVADAIQRGDMDDLRDELGDLLLQVVYHAQMAAEKNAFTFDDVVAGVSAKMIHRHPHVFGDMAAHNADDVAKLWEDRKDLEGKRQMAGGILDDVTLNLPALMRAQKLQKRAARVGFEWNAAIDVLDKMEEEIAEMREAIRGGREAEIKDELGDLFFVLTNFGRMLGADCEDALRHANDKFTRRFKHIEQTLRAHGIDWSQTSLEEMEDLWREAKMLERQGNAA